MYFKTLLLRLGQEEETLQARTRAEELEKENLDLAANLAKKEQEMDLRLQEKVNIVRKVQENICK